MRRRFSWLKTVVAFALMLNGARQARSAEDYTSDSLAVAAILTANGWGMPVVDSLYGAWSRWANVEAVTDTANGRIVTLRLKGILWTLTVASGLQPCRDGCCCATVLGPEIGRLTALDSLDVSENFLRELPPEIGNLRELTTLTLSTNNLRAIPPTIGQLTKLTYLEMIGAGKQLEELPDEIGNLESLQTLYLYDNNLRSLPVTIGNLKSLVYLNLFWNPLRALPESVGDLCSLEYLDVHGCSLTALPESIGRLTRLRELFLSDNQLRALPASIVHLSTNISVRQNELCDVPCPIQDWLDLRQPGIWGWRYTQRCAVRPVPPCSTAVVQGPRPAAARPGRAAGPWYDLLGRPQLPAHGDGGLPGAVPQGVYMVPASADRTQRGMRLVAVPR